MRAFLISIILFFCFSVVSFGQKTETLFYGENTFKNPVKIPAQALKLLSQDERINECTLNNSQTKFSAELFEATFINLNDDKLPDLLVKAKDDNNCINGNAISFWLFKSEAGSYSLVLYLYTIIVSVEEEKHQKFYDINASRSTPSTTYQTNYVFNGVKYEQKSKEEFPINPK